MKTTNIRCMASVLVLCCATVITWPATSAEPASSLEQQFRSPPNSARPRVWWHWMNGNISEEGIRQDIEWMSRVGIGGLQNFDAALNTPQIVDQRLVYMTPGWKQAFRHAAEQAELHGLELAIAGSPGWSETGGPWVQPEHGMKKLVWSDITLPGGQRFSGKLPPLPDVTGPFQDVPGQEMMASGEGAHAAPRHVAAAAVVAFRLPDGSAALPLPRYSAGDGVVLDAAKLVERMYADSLEVAMGADDRPPVIHIDFDAPQTVRALTIHLPGSVGPLGDATLAPVLEVAGDGDSWRKLADAPLSAVPTTVSFPAVTAQRFRVVLKPVAGNSVMQAMLHTPPGVDLMSMASSFGPGALQSWGQAAQHLKVSELHLQAEPRVDNFEAKAGFAIAGDYYAPGNASGPDEQAIDPGNVIDLTGKVGAGGSLDWTPPAGQWRVLRFGYSLTGKTNHPAPPEATGLEVDKYDGKAVREYLETYLGMYRDAAGEDLVGERGLKAFLTDSIEVGPSNWTPDMIGQFQRLRGYDPTPWLPALAGVIVGSRQQSDAFLYDFRRTLADLLVSQHYAVIAAVAREHGLTYYSEALENMRPTLGDDMSMRMHADIPMAAMWAYGVEGPRPNYIADIRGAASVAHIYGQNLVAAESLTSSLRPWAMSPADLRPIIDLEFAHGVNRPVIHTSVHQPADDKQPGLALLIFGQYFNRHETWAEMAGPWVDYMARNSLLLQQGRNVADVAWFYGEEAPLVKLYEAGLPEDAPTRYAFDFVNADALLGALTVEGLDLVTPEGARYHLLYLGGSSRYMTLPVLRQLGALAAAGATIVGPAPQRSPSLADDAAEFDALVEKLWGDGAGGKAGKGRVINSTDVESVLASLGVAPDFTYSPQPADSEILFQHRRLADGDIYFVNNRANREENIEARFRVIGKRPEIWRADTGEILPVSYRIEQEQTVIPLVMAPQDSFFVVFRQPAEVLAATVPAPTWTPLADIGAGPWQVSFQPGRGAPEGITLAPLAPLDEHPSLGVKYFSGIATYRKTFELPAAARPGAPLWLDLGAVGDLAEAYVNGTKAGTAWREPYRVEIGGLVTPGNNELEIRVANLWVNRLVGDAQPGAEKISWTSTPIYLPTAPLRPAGLIGPVRLLGASPG